MTISVSEGPESAGIAASARTPAPLPRIVVLLWIASAVLLVLAVVVGWIEWRLGWPIQEYNPLGNPRHEDLLELIPEYALLHTAAFFTGPKPVAYLPLAAVIYAVIYATKHPVLVFRATAALWLAGGVLGVKHALMKRGITQWAATLFPLTL